MPRLNSLDLFSKFSCFNVHSNVSPYNFNFTGKTVPFPSTDVIMVALFCCSSGFFPQKGSILLFSFGHAFNKIAKPKCKRSFTELFKGYIFYIFIIIIIISSISNYSKLRDFFKNIYLQKIKEFIVYDGLYYISLQAGLKNIYFFLVVFTESNENMFWIF